MERLAEEGVEKAIISDPTNILYLAGAKIKPYERFLALVLDSKKKKTTFILPSLEKSVNTDPAIAKVLYGDHEDPIDKLMDVLDNTETIGVEKEYLSMSLAEKVADRHGDRLLDIGPLVLDLRRYKSPQEIENIQTAVDYGDRILEEIKRYLRPGRTEKEITFELMKRMSLKSGVMLDEFVIQVLSGINSENPHGMAGDKKIEKGDPITIDLGVNYAHYWSDCTRTFFLGLPDPRYKTIYQVVLDAQKKAITQVRPGTPICEVDMAARQVIEKAGYGEFFIHRTGHGIGLDIHELPSVHGQNKRILREGMVITVEPGIYVPGLGGVRIEDDVVANGEGCTVLNAYPKDFEDMLVSM